jgi:hypothetical protein
VFRGPVLSNGHKPFLEKFGKLIYRTNLTDENAFLAKWSALLPAKKVVAKQIII